MNPIFEINAAPLKDGQIALLTAMDKVRRAVGGRLVKTESAPVGKGENQRLLTFINREKVLAVLTPHCEKEGLVLYFTGADNPAPNMIRQALVVAGISGAHKGARMVFTQDYPVTPAAGVQGAQYVGATQTYASARLMAQAFALELALEKDVDRWETPEQKTAESTEPALKCMDCGEPMNRRVSGPNSKNPGRAFHVCGHRDFKDDSTKAHSFVFEDEAVRIGVNGAWEQKKAEGK